MLVGHGWVEADDVVLTAAVRVTRYKPMRQVQRVANTDGVQPLTLHLQQRK